jgi:hypothetical protein
MVLIEKEWVGMGHKFLERTGKEAGKSSEISPIFLQFLDCVAQLLYQFPCSFEYNHTFLITIADEVSHFSAKF